MDKYDSLASVAIIRTDSDTPDYLLEEKTPGYHHEKLVGGIWLIGGSKDQRHRNFRHIMETELMEEIPEREEITKEIIRRFKFYRGFELSEPGEHLTGFQGDYSTVLVAVFESILPTELARSVGVSRGTTLAETEGRIQVYGEEDLERLEFGWGFNQVMERYLSEQCRGKKLKPKLPGTIIRAVDIDPEAQLG